MRLGIDMDGVVIWNDPSWKRQFDAYAEEHGHRELGVIPVSTWEYFPELCGKCFHECVNDPGILLDSDIVDGAIETLIELSGEDHELHLISHRPEELVGDAARTMMRFYGITHVFDSMTFSFAPKIETCEAHGVEMMLDDSPRNIFELQGTSVTPVIFTAEYNLHLPRHIARVSRWQGFAEMVRRLEYARS